MTVLRIVFHDRQFGGSFSRLVASARRAIAILAVALLLPFPVPTARGGETGPPSPPWRELSVGADVADNVWLLYSGVTLAPLGEIDRDGLRLRSGGGYGQYRYSGHRSGDPRGTTRKYLGTVTYVDALVGYQQQFGPLTAKAFVGIAAIDHAITPGDPIALGGLLAQGMDYGAKGVLELWLNLGRNAWTSLDASWTSAHQTYSARWRIGYRLAAPMSIGVEAGVNGNALDASPYLPDGNPREELKPAGRVGVFARYEWGGNEISASAGLSRNAWEVDEDVELRDAYATVNYLMRY